MPTERFQVNFELIGNATSLTAAVASAQQELERSGSAISADSAQLAHQISGIFAQALKQIAAESETVNSRIQARAQVFQQKIAQLRDVVFPKGAKTSKNDLLSRLLGLDESTKDNEVVKELRTRVEGILNQTLDTSINSKKNPNKKRLVDATREALKDMFGDAAKEAAKAEAKFQNGADIERLRYLNRLRRNISKTVGKFDQGRVGTLDGQLHDSVRFLSNEQFLDRPVNKNLRERGVSNTLLNKLTKDVVDLREKRKVLLKVLKDIEHDYEEAQRRIGGTPDGRQKERLGKLATTLEDQANKVRSAVDKYSKQIIRLDGIEDALSRPRTLRDRGTSAALLKEHDKTIQGVIDARRRVAALTKEIQDDLAAQRRALRNPEISAEDKRRVYQNIAEQRKALQQLRKTKNELKQEQTEIDQVSAVGRGVKGSLEARGLDQRKLSGVGKSIAQLRQDRREIRTVQAQIESDLKKAFADLAQTSRKSPKVPALRDLVENLREQRQQVRVAVSGINDELANVARRSPFQRFRDFFQFGLLAGGLYRISSAIQSITRSVFDASAEFQRLRTSFVSILAEPVLDSKQPFGVSALDPATLSQLSGESSRIFQNAQINAIRTVATTKEYVTTLQSALAVGQQVGLTQSQVEEITLNMVRAAGAFGIEMEKVGSSVAQIFTGSVRVTNQLARNLGLATTAQREQLKEAIKTNNLYGFLIEKTKAFAETGEIVEDNFLNVRAAMSDIVEFGGAQAIEPLFHFINRALIDVRERFLSGSSIAVFRSPLVGFISKIQKAFEELIPSIADLVNEVATALSNLVNALSSTGLSGIKLLIEGLAVVVRTIGQIIGATNDFNGKLGSAVFYLGAAKILLGSLAGLSKSLGSGLTSLSNFFESLKPVRQQTLPGIAEGGFAVARGIGAARDAVTGASASLAAFASKAASVAGVIGALVLAAQLAYNAYQEWRGTTDKLRQAQEELSKSLAKIEDDIRSEIETAQVLNNVYETLKLARAAKQDPNADRTELEASLDKLSGFLSEAQRLKLESGEITADILDTVAEEIARVGETFKVEADRATQVANLSMDRLNQLYLQIAAAQARVDQVRQSGRGGGIAAETFSGIDTAALEADVDRAKTAYAEASKAILDFAASRGIATEGLLQDRERLQKVVDLAATFNKDLEAISRSSEFYKLSFDQQIETLADLNIRISENNKAIRENRGATTDDIAVRKALKDTTAGLTTIKAAENEQIEQQLELTFGSREAVLEFITAKQHEYEQTLKGLELTKEVYDLQIAQIAAEHSLQLARGDSLEQFLQTQAVLLALVAQSASFEEGIAKVRAAIAENQRIGRRFAQQGKSDAEDKAKLKKGRDILSDYLQQLERELALMREANQQIDDVYERLFNTRSKALQKVTETGAIYGLANQFAIERNLINDQYKFAVKAINRNLAIISLAEQTALELARRVEADTKLVEESSTRDILNPDERSRTLEVTERIQKLLNEEYKRRQDASQKFEDGLTQIVERQSKLRLDLVKAEIDAQQKLRETYAKAQATFDQQLAQLGKISPATAVFRETARAIAENRSKFDDQVKALFPILLPSNKKALIDSASELFAAIEATTGNPSESFVNLLAILQNDIPSSLNGVADLVRVIRQESQKAFDESFLVSPTLDLIDAKRRELQEAFVNIANAEKAYTAALAAPNPNDETIRTAARARVAALDQYQKVTNEALAELTKASPNDKEIEKIKNLFEARARFVEALASSVDANASNRYQALSSLIELDIQGKELSNKLELDALELTKSHIQARLELNSVVAQQIESERKLIDQQLEFGVITERQAENQRADLADIEIRAIEARRRILEQQLRTTFAGVAEVGGIENASPEIRGAITGIYTELQSLIDKENDLRLSTIKLAGTFSVVANGLGKVGDAFNEFGSDSAIGKLGTVFNALKGLFEVLESRRLRRLYESGEIKKPESFEEVVKRAGSGLAINLTAINNELQKSSKDIATAMQKALNDPQNGFVETVKRAAREFRDILLPLQKKVDLTPDELKTSIDQFRTGNFGDTNPNAVSTVGGVVVDDNLREAAERAAPPTEVVERKMETLAEVAFDNIIKAAGAGAAGGVGGGPQAAVRSRMGEVFEAVLGAVASSVSGFARGGAGGIIGGIGGATSAIGGLFSNSQNGFLKNLPVVGAALGVLGGIFDIFAAKARQQAEKIAKEVGEGIDKLKQAFQDGKISLAEAISGINAQVASAQSRLTGGKIGKKGGNAAFAQIQDQANQAIEELRRQAEATQKEFREALNLLRKPAELRDIITQINEARKKAEEFLRSFESSDGLVNATAEAMEFFRLTIAEIRKDIEDSLKDLRKQLKESAEQFEKQREDILNQGRIAPAVSEAENKRRQLVELERNFRERQNDLLKQIATEEKKLELVNRRADIEFKIAQYTERSARALSEAAERLGRVLGTLGTGGHNGGGGFGGAFGFENSPQVGDLIMNNKIEVNVGNTNASADEIGVAVSRHLQLAGRTNHFRQRQTTGQGNF